jgi:hypothetical protein
MGNSWQTRTTVAAELQRTAMISSSHRRPDENFAKPRVTDEFTLC